MKTPAVVFLMFLCCRVSAQSSAPCDTIYTFLPTMAQYENGNMGFLKYFKKTLGPILSGCIQEDGEYITSMHIKLTIDASGNVIAVEFPRLQASDACKEKLRNEFLCMKGWTAGQIDGKPVCSYYNLPIGCLKWN